MRLVIPDSLNRHTCILKVLSTPGMNATLSCISYYLSQACIRLLTTNSLLPQRIIKFSHSLQAVTMCSSCVRRARRSSWRSWPWWAWPANRCTCGAYRSPSRSGWPTQEQTYVGLPSFKLLYKVFAAYCVGARSFRVLCKVFGAYVGEPSL